MSLRSVWQWIGAATLAAIPLADVPGVVAGRCRHCNRPVLCSDQASILITQERIVYLVACTRCWTSEREQQLRDQIVAIAALQPDDPFAGFPKGQAA